MSSMLGELLLDRRSWVRCHRFMPQGVSTQTLLEWARTDADYALCLAGVLGEPSLGRRLAALMEREGLRPRHRNPGQVAAAHGGPEELVRSLDTGTRDPLYGPGRKGIGRAIAGFRAAVDQFGGTGREEKGAVLRAARVLVSRVMFWACPVTLWALLQDLANPLFVMDSLQRSYTVLGGAFNHVVQALMSHKAFSTCHLRVLVAYCENAPRRLADYDYSRVLSTALALAVLRRDEGMARVALDAHARSSLVYQLTVPYDILEGMLDLAVGAEGVLRICHESPSADIESELRDRDFDQFHGIEACLKMDDLADWVPDVRPFFGSIQVDEGSLRMLTDAGMAGPQMAYYAVLTGTVWLLDAMLTRGVHIPDEWQLPMLQRAVLLGQESALRALLFRHRWRPSGLDAGNTVTDLHMYMKEQAKRMGMATDVATALMFVCSADADE